MVVLTDDTDDYTQDVQHNVLGSSCIVFTTACSNAVFPAPLLPVTNKPGTAEHSELWFTGNDGERTPTDALVERMKR